MENITKEVNQIVEAILKFDNKENLSWTRAYKKVLKEIGMEDKMSDNFLLSSTVKEITKRGYDIIGEPFKLEKYK